MKPAYQLAAVDSTPVMVVSNFFTGHVPENEAVMTRLLGVVSVQEPSYAASGSADPEMAGYEVLGLGFAKAFPAAVQLGSANDYIVDTYASAFGRDASGEQVIHFLQQEAYFFGMYVSAGLSNEDASVQARGVVIGQILCWAVREEGSPLNTAAGEAASAYLQGNFDYGKALDDYAVEPVIVEVEVEVEVPGDTVYVPVPGPEVIIDKADVIAQSFGTIDVAHQNAKGGLLFGDGTTAAQGLVSVYDPTSGFTIASGVSPRQSVEGNYRPDKIAFDGVTMTADYVVPAGAQLAANGSQADLATRGADNWSFTFGSTKVALADFIADGGKLVIGIDQDAGAGVARLMMESVVAADGTIDFTGFAGLINITDSGGNANTVANSQQQNFYLPTGIAALTVGSHFSNSFEVFDANGVKLVGLVENLLLGAPGFSPNDQLI